ncbi:MAG: GNAT family N-acetyltransferase, partial [Ignavibacteria bacterium]
MSLTVRPIQPSETLRFIKSQWLFYKNEKHWVPPMLMDRKKLLDTKKNPFYQHSQIQCFLAERNGQIVGRIAAIINGNHNKTHNDKAGFFGFFDCINDQEVANELFRAAEAWVRERGMDEMRGPVNPSMNDE